VHFGRRRRARVNGVTGRTTFDSAQLPTVGHVDKIALKVIQGHSLCNELQANKGLHIVLLAEFPKFSKT